MTIDLLDRLRMDAGRRTLGELLQERQWAVGEIETLRDGLGRAQLTRTKATASEPPARVTQDRLLRLAEVCEIVGLSRSTIYQRMAEGTFPRQCHAGLRAAPVRAST